ncbi:hypothetical protein DUZ99_01060 [Xylanibacillus composti]|uniref:Uncharacterized protein n=1 Tax=Xylanibacillus composti TaxID=1572762 RepID=A0A8J4H018_9BACL|nr:hypothetical protein [Xylanibacillus composti]MDT9723607.1 hypothetical protein [Xylanibacillus composti]GIQ68354.1 hypothetical protein XYCOK13_11780 [Xylanibacillus composti]
MEITDRLLEVLRYQLRKEGLSVKQPNPDEALIISRDEKPLAYVQDDGFVLYPAGDYQESSKRIAPLVSQVWEMERAYQEAPAMGIDSVSEYRKLLDYNGYVLATRYDGEGEFTFVNWQYTYNKSAVSLGHYFHKNAYSEAKEDFLFRSGLAEDVTSFRLDELSVIREALLFRGIQDAELSSEDRVNLDRVLHRIDALLLPIDKLLLEAEAEADRER